MFDEKRNFIVLLGILILLASFGGIISLSSEIAATGTPKGGMIAINETWTLAGSPYWIEGNVVITKGATLTIDPGVEIKFNGYYSIFVDGNIIAAGNESNRIIITSNSTAPASGDWDKIQINSTGHSEISYCNISYGRYGIYISNSNFNNLSNNRIISQSWSGIYLYFSSFNSIINNYISKNQFGAIYLINSTNNNIENNIIFSNLNIFRAVTLESSSNNTLINNFMTQNYGGIYLRFESLHNIIVNNKIMESWEGINLEASDSHSPNSNIIANNNFTFITGFGMIGTGSYNSIINNNFINNLVNDAMGQFAIDLKGVNNNILSNNNISGYGQGIQIHLSDKNSIKNNTISSNNGTGVIISNSDRNTIENNTIVSNKGDGLLLQNYAELNNVTSNNIFQNSGDGIQLNLVFSNNIIFNIIEENVEGGIYIQHSGAEDNNIHHNNFINNRQSVSPQCLDVSFYKDNHWDNGYSPYGSPYGGNYWNDWTSPDNMMGPNQDNPWCDGIVDDPYSLDSNSRDNYPLTDLIDITLHQDITPPVITKILPSDKSIINDSYQPISAAYSDNLGINISSVLLRLDDINVTSSAEVTENSINYTPTIQLFDGVHTVYLEVKDYEKNTGWVIWSFTVDTTPPIITNFQPFDNSFINDSFMAISAEFYDNSTVNISSVILKIDNIDVTSSAVITENSVMYSLSTPLLEGVHSIYLKVNDILNNIGTAIWSFTVDTTPPVITNLQPSNLKIINDTTPMISAVYSDNSSIKISGVVLRIDETNVTSFANITQTCVNYIPTAPLSDGMHIVYLEVKDIINNTRIGRWSFSVDTISPIITNLMPIDRSILKDNTPEIRAIYIDASDINSSDIFLKIDDTDVTSFANITETQITYTPTVPLTDGMHSAFLEVKDIANNIATTKWTFTVDATLPFITNLQPLDNSYIKEKMPLISANYSDNMGINISSIRLKIDNIDVTSSALITATCVEYTPATPLPDGVYTIYIEVMDYVENTETATWSFTVDTTPPIANAGDDKRIMVGEIINFNGNTSKDNIDSLEQLNFTWRIIKDGDIITTLYNVTPSFTYNKEGQYSVKLIVRDKTGNNGFDNMLVIVTLPSHDSEPDTISLSDLLAEYWIIILTILIFIILMVVLFLYWSRNRIEKDSKITSGEKIMEEEIEE